MNKVMSGAKWSTLLILISFLPIMSACSKTFEAQYIGFEVPDNLQSIEIIISDSESDKFTYNSTDKLLFFDNLNGMELVTVPVSEVNAYFDQAAGVYTFQVVLIASTSSVAYEFKLPYLKLSNGDWCRITDDSSAYTLNEEIMNWPADGRTLWETMLELE